MSSGPIGREGKGTPRRGVPAEKEAVRGGGVGRDKSACVKKKKALLLALALLWAFAVHGSRFMVFEAVRVRWWLHGGSWFEGVRSSSSWGP